SVPYGRSPPRSSVFVFVADPPYFAGSPLSLHDALPISDETTFAYLEGRPHAPEGAEWDAAMEYWKTLRTDDDAVFDAEVVLEAADLEPYVTWGTNPGQGLPISGRVPVPEEIGDENARIAAERAVEYMDLVPGTPLRDIAVDTVFIGSCTHGRIEGLRP